MAAVARLVTSVDLNDRADAGPEARSLSVRARHEAVLADGRRVLLLDDRGWTAWARVSWGREPTEEERERVEEESIWASQTLEDLQQTARVVVGPDEPFGEHTQASMRASHWDTLARILHEQGVEAAGADLQALPHDVEVSDRVLARLAHGHRDDPR